MALKLTKEVLAMKGKRMLTIAMITGVLALVGEWAISAQDKYSLKVPMGWRFLNSKDTRPGRLSPSAIAEMLWLRPLAIR